MYKINYWLTKTDKYRSPLDSPYSKSLSEVFILLEDLSPHENDEIGIHTELDTSQFTIYMIDNKNYWVEILLTARYTKKMERNELIYILLKFDEFRKNPKKFGFNVEPD